MTHYITVDSGTTNTRLSLVCGGAVTETLKYPVGTGDKELLTRTLREGIARLLAKTDRVERILASGMITSEFGLCELPHLSAPAGLKELHGGMHETVLEEISPIPFVFMRGLKTAAPDMMRGEETELMGLFSGEGLYVLPGSHSKLIRCDEKGAVLDFKTMLTGEMIHALHGHTLLKNSFSLQEHPMDREHLLLGYEDAKANGLNHTLFRVRVLKNLLGKTEEEVYAYFMGAVLCDEIQAILSEPAPRIILSGQAQIKQAMAILLTANTDRPVTVASDTLTNHSTALGMVKIYEYRE